MNEAVLRSALNEIEKREMPLLTWGVSNGTLSEAELMGLLESVAPGEDPEELIDALDLQGLIVTKGIGELRYRSRMAETVRLATTLRQWFHSQSWESAKGLVSDARFLSRPRIVPKRNQSSSDLSGELEALLGPGWTLQHERAMDAVLGGREVSAFQARAMKRLVHTHVGPRGTVITAGTGSGKTLAFYLPALTRLLATPWKPGVPRVIAIYPRVELLRDQLRNLLLQCQALTDAGETAPRVGVLYGAVPHDRRNAATDRRRGWLQREDGLQCPIIDCLAQDCEGKYIWKLSAGKREELTCELCGTSLREEQFTFTRSRLRDSPPPILFTTTEMLNQYLGSASLRRLLVGDGTRSPEFLLLDEVHTYAGSHGAQVALLLRRWRAELATPPHVVGLSATLSDPVGFFSDLVGLNASSVGVVSPEPNEMIEIGREYFLALRGDPASQTSLLSTTIQTSMLLRRMLDLNSDQPSHGTFGSRVFVFTDDLDVTNRLHSQLEDAEGWKPGGVNRKPAGSLAELRSTAGVDRAAREEAGQMWDFAERTGTLNLPVRVSRTTSRDAGVDASADIVVATASLEVGFDDPDVGAVLQHKAPREAAQFLQRRGRAGRNPLMRPWTVIVLSDYGRDRLAFQSYEALFDPVVATTQLPLRNRVILKMQATWWLTDYLGSIGPATRFASLIAQPWDDRDEQRRRANRLLSATRELLTPTGIERLSALLRRSLALPDEDVRAVLWDHPRGLITAVVPALIRRLEAVGSANLPDSFDWSNALAEFVPSRLFSPLQTPEVTLEIPDHVGEGESEPVSQAMRQFAPGRVSYRYALGGRRERLWVTPPPSHQATLAIESMSSSYIDLEVPPNVCVDQLVQPTSLQLDRPPGPTSDSCYGRWTWNVAFASEGVPLRLDLPSRTPWWDDIPEFEALTHRHRCPLTIWRYAESFDVEWNSSREPPVTHHNVTLSGSPAAVGFAMDVDAVRLRVRLPTHVPTNARLLRALRVTRMEYLIKTSPALSEAVPSAFTRDWLHQVLLSVLVSDSNGRTLEATLMSFTDEQLRQRLIDASREIFGASPIGGDEDGTGQPDPGLVSTVAAAVQVPEVLAELRAAATTLWAEPGEDWLAWYRQRYLTTLAAALVDAVQSSCPHVDTSDLRCDIGTCNSEQSDAIGTICISEDQPGGVGIVEALLDRYLEDPRSFWALVAAALGPCNGERVDYTLRQFLIHANQPTLSAAVATIRSATELASLTEGWRDLRLAMFQLGLDSDQSVVSALATRILRPGSTRSLEQLVADLLRRWDDLELSLGVEVELRVFAHVAAGDPDIRRQLHATISGQSTPAGWEIGQLTGVLWPRGHRLRSEALKTYSPYIDFEPTERLAFEDTISQGTATVDATLSDWRIRLDEALRHSGSATLHAPDDRRAAVAIGDLITEPTSVDVLEFHPRVVGVTRSAEGLDVLIELREAQQ